jgi:hypothetical protein
VRRAEALLQGVAIDDAILHEAGRVAAEAVVIAGTHRAIDCPRRRWQLEEAYADRVVDGDKSAAR